MGGEITWKCLGTGEFQFQMKLYRDCNGGAAPVSPILDVFNAPILQINMSMISKTDISPQCNSAGPAISCASPAQGAVEEYIYQSAPIFITGVPPAAGWVFTYSDCCRNVATTNLVVSSTTGFTLRSIMYAYNNQNTNPCYDNSPEFLESPKTIICTGYPFTYNHNAIDVELDSLSFDWAEPLDKFTASTPTTYNPGVDPPFIPFATGFAFNNPMPGTILNPGNLPATINPTTGEIDFTSFTSGSYSTCIKVQAWKCNQLVAEVFREMQIILLPCATNSPPVITPPFQDANGLFTLFADTVYAGQTVSFALNTGDNGVLPNGNPQTISIGASGSQFGAGFSSTTTGCLNPPCATLTQPPPLSSPTSVSTNFNWQTTCDHISSATACYVRSNTYNFIIRTQDDFCPAPGQSIATISITVLALPLVESPNVHCVAVDAAGDVTLTWTQPSDTGGTFDSYHIFTSTNAVGPFVLLDSIFNYNQLTYTHVGAGANNGSIYYYIQTRSGCNGIFFSPPKDTVSSIYLQANNNSNLTATLNWNNITTPPSSSQLGWFRIYKEYPTGIWTLIDSTQFLTYTDSIPYCNQLVRYRIEIGDTLGCVSISSVDDVLAQDQIVPTAPVMDTVSVDANGNAILGWQSSVSTDVTAYIIFQNINNVWTVIDTVYGYSTQQYTYTNSNADQGSERYTIVAVDSCGNVSVSGLPHRTLFVTGSVDICTASANLVWNQYINFSGGVAGYEILASENGGSFQSVGTTLLNDTQFTHANLTQFSTYCYIIRAFDAAGQYTSSSQELCLLVDVPQQPAYQYLRVTSVMRNGDVEIKGFVDNTVNMKHYAVFRSETLGGSWTLIGTVPTNSTTTSITYIDVNAATNQKSYYYKMVAIDSCGYESFASNLGRTILVQASSNNEITNTIFWNDYEVWSGSVLLYNIYRGIDGLFDPTPIATIPYSATGVNEYIDDVNMFVPTGGKFSYYVEALEGAGNMYGFSDTSYSNIAVAGQKPLVYVPNAFSPNGNGLNDNFIPSTGFVDLEQYNFYIFDRWGTQIFHSTNKVEGWDGSHNSEKCQQGVYVWILRFRTATGEYIDLKGTVTLVR
jgi:gliding motility-associated-like protein